MTDEEFEEFEAVLAYGEDNTKEENMTKDITETLGQREGRYGEYVNVAATAQQLKETLRSGDSWGIMEAYMQESLDLIANKLARIVNGDPFYDDSWHDVGGYAKLVEIELNKGKVMPTLRRLTRLSWVRWLEIVTCLHIISNTWRQW